MNQPQDQNKDLDIDAKDENLKDNKDTEVASLPHENMVTEDILNASRMNEDPNTSPDKEMQTNNPDEPPKKVRLDRFGTEIVPRALKLKNQMKTGHKVTYIDQIHI